MVPIGMAFLVIGLGLGFVIVLGLVLGAGLGVVLRVYRLLGR